MSMIPPAPIAPPPGTEPAGFPDPRDAIAAMVAANGGPAVDPASTTGLYQAPPPPPPIESFQLPQQSAPVAPIAQPGYPPAPPQYAPPAAPAPAVDPFAAGATPPAPAPPAPAPGYPPAPGAVGAPPSPTTVQLPDGTIIGLDRLSELALLDRSFSGNPEVERAVKEAVTRQNLFAPPAPGGAVGAPPMQPASPVPGVVWPQQPVMPAQTPPLAPAPVVLPPPSQFPQAPAASPFAPMVQLPPDVDPTDPTVQWTAHQLQAMGQQQAQIAQAIQIQQQQTAEANARSSSAGIAAARQDIARKYPYLTFDDIAQLETRAGQLQLGTAYMNMYGDHHRAAFEAMDSAALTIPELRPKLQAAPPGTQATIDAQRQAALNALAGGGGAAPRAAEPQPRQMTSQEKVSGMAQELAAHLAGGPT